MFPILKGCCVLPPKTKQNLPTLLSLKKTIIFAQQTFDPNFRPELRRLGQGIEVVIADVGHRGHTFALGDRDDDGTTGHGFMVALKERWHPRAVLWVSGKKKRMNMKSWPFFG